MSEQLRSNEDSSKVKPFDIIRLITEAEHHFNNLCFKIRVLASTWLLATFAGAGFLLANTFEFIIQKNTIVIMVCWAGAIGILVLWILDIQVYQKLLNVWFDSREKIEEKNPDLPNIRDSIKASQPGGRATNLIKVYYMITCSAPLVFAFAVTKKILEKENTTSSYVLCITSIVILFTLNTVIYFLSPKDPKEGLG